MNFDSVKKDSKTINEVEPEFRSFSSGVLKRYIIQKCVISGNKVEFYKYSMPIRCEFERLPSPRLSKSEVKRDDNLSRARLNVRRIIWCNLTPHTKFLTLTTAETCLDYDDFVNHKMHAFFQSMKRQGYELRYLYVLERQLKRGVKEGNAGSIHAHLVVFNDEKIPLKVLRKAWSYGRTELKILNSLRYECNDGVYKKGDRVVDVGSYVCKYITKEASSEFGSRTYRCSRGVSNRLLRPVVVNVVGDGDLSCRIGPELFDDDVNLVAFINLLDASTVDYMDSKIIPLRFTENDRAFQIIDYIQGTI